MESSLREDQMQKGSRFRASTRQPKPFTTLHTVHRRMRGVKGMYGNEGIIRDLLEP